ncbi:Signal transduction histidine kinase [Streptomyces zhaozhouensis]|uniref:histidine kinase n=1 Tax=Streptomyces zhaozhouensis TaxID=1300267 RepID=A0A286DYT3_9ACTN|nr:ATP-binding protein [Streptomyces zhaozhouensis]SOD63815.1 Signal transduction histidine kinase [Streptomyces zhaozhouensis]
MNGAGLRSRLSGERARLTALYGGLLVAVSGVVIALVYEMARQNLGASMTRAVVGAPLERPSPLIDGTTPRYDETTYLGSSDTQAVTDLVDVASEAALDRLLVISLIALACCAGLSMLVSWWMAGRVLRPLRVITSTARRLSGHSLHERIALKAPPGELKELADTFDAMLDRIETLLTAQQRFTANAAHELRTSLATQRAAAEIGLADPDPHQVERIRRKLVDVADDNERLIEALLLLSVTDQGLQHAEPVRLDTVAAAVAAEFEESEELEAEDGRRISLRTEALPLTVTGEAILLEHLVRNLVGNAVRYNTPGGKVEVRTGAEGLRVTNTGPPVPPGVVTQLFEPFRRLQARQHAPGEGAGLGLSIVASIARAHGAIVTAEANPDGGLTVRVVFPPPTAAPGPAGVRGGAAR